jgi:hypothetical protein
VRVEVLDAEVDADARGAEVVGGVLEVVRAGADHDHVVAQPQLGVRDGAVGVVVAGEDLEAEGALEEVERGARVAVHESRMDGHAGEASPRARPRLGRM